MKLFLKNSNLCDHNSPTSQTDRQTTCDRNTALCTKVHRAVKSVSIYVQPRPKWQPAHSTHYVSPAKMLRFVLFLSVIIYEGRMSQWLCTHLSLQTWSHGWLWLAAIYRCRRWAWLRRWCGWCWRYSTPVLATHYIIIPTSSTQCSISELSSHNCYHMPRSRTLSPTLTWSVTTSH